ncbi:HAD-IIB family hydrolase [Neorhodopirellula pilleata]|uniref:Malto-oligosyltrehalose trehalohydrolase n=1 Tax=Neorhodopirellula pilleata TaxID=2714738 RepID=A0A5C6ARG3_9BACT|nr:HAD-IIB family hydrolase [Neorhodopirellula pilleata]TWU02071.1 Malto-oligosyltrehalose trehalohydrolase [Neorhodopirellula pilleata]
MKSKKSQSFNCRVLATDLDGTFLPLSGDEQAENALMQIRGQIDSERLPLVFVTGRHVESVFDAIAVDGLPQPGWIICDVGTSIYRLDPSARSDRPTQESLAASYSRVADYDAALNDKIGHTDVEELRHAIGDLPDIRLQESIKQGRHKLSYYVSAEKLDECRERIEQHLADRSLPYGIISSVDPFNNDGLIDVLPEGVSKAFALNWWCSDNGYEPPEVVFCGDSGNDFAALVAGYRAVVVANAARPLAEHIRQTHQTQGWTDRLFLATATSTGGVLQGMQWFGLHRNEDETDVDDWPTPSWGANLIGCRTTHFSLFAPAHSRICLNLFDDPSPQPTRQLDMNSTCAGWHQLVVRDCPAGTRYQFTIGRSGTSTGDHHSAFFLSDPASRFQPDGVHGPSQVIDRQFPWQHDWTPRTTKREDLVVYEMHIGAFTTPGTYLSAIERLDELVELGVTAIELMPIAECPGRWNWGYDATHWFAPMHTFGTPEELRMLVDAAHARGLLVFADVVYNHFGPEGNQWSLLGDYLSTKHHTPWGAAPNFDEGDSRVAIRRFVIDNAIYWLDEYHLDGLRVDAIHCMADDSDEHITRQFGREVRQWADAASRRIWLIAESNVYDASMIANLDDGGNGFDAQWCDDFAHSLFAVVRPGERLTVRTYQPDADLAGALHRGFLFQGNVHGYRGREEPVPDERVDTSGLIYCIQNHDFIGNHPTGQRFHHVTSVEAQAAAAAMLILSPAIPMLFMGEEFASENPFAFFVDFGSEQLRAAVVEGRKREYPQHDWSGGVLPIDPVAFESAKIGPADHGNTAMRLWYRDLISLRKRMISSGVLDGNRLQVATDVDNRLYLLHYEGESESMTVASRLLPSKGELIRSEEVSALLNRQTVLPEPRMDSLQALNASPPAQAQTLIWF